MKTSFYYLFHSNSSLLAVDIDFTNIVTVRTDDPLSAIVDLHQRCGSAPQNILDNPIETQYEVQKVVKQETCNRRCFIVNVFLKIS